MSDLDDRRETAEWLKQVPCSEGCICIECVLKAMRQENERMRAAIESVMVRYRLRPPIAKLLSEVLANHEPDPDADVIARILDGPEITPRDAFECGFDAGSNWGLSLDQEAPTPFEKATELAWEHFQAERMKAAASTEPCPDIGKDGHNHPANPCPICGGTGHGS